MDFDVRDAFIGPIYSRPSRMCLWLIAPPICQFITDIPLSVPVRCLF